MALKPIYRLSGLGPNLLKHLWCLRVGRTCKEKVLPHNDSGLIAESIEIFALINPTTPDSDGVDIYYQHLINSVSVTLGAHSAWKGIIWNPIRAANPQPLAIYLDRK